MAAVTYYVVLPFLRVEDGEVYPGEGIEMPSERVAVSRAGSLASGHAGVVAFSRSGNPATGEYEPATILACHGELPSDILAFCGG